MSTVASFSAILRASATRRLDSGSTATSSFGATRRRQLAPRHVDQRLRIERLDDVVGRPFAHRRDRLRDGAVGRHQHHRQIGPHALDRGQQLVAVRPRHLHVRDHQGDFLALQQLQRLGRIGRGQRRNAGGLQRVDQCLAQRGVVLDDQDRFVRLVHAVSSAGKSMMKVAPRRAHSARRTLPVMRLDHGFDDGKPDAVAARAGGEKGLEDPLADVRRHAGAVVAHDDLRAAVAPRGAPAVPDRGPPSPPAAHWWPGSEPRTPATARWPAP